MFGISPLLKEKAKETIARVLGKYFKIGKEILIFEAGSENFKELEFLAKNSSFPILLVSRPEDADDIDKIKKLAEIMPARGYLILNSDIPISKEIKEKSNLKSLTFGFENGADLQATDINISGEEINFKINYQGVIVPFWLKNSAGQEAVYGVLPAVCAGIAMGLNLVQISQVLREEHFLSK